jgi:cytochrome P450
MAVKFGLTANSSEVPGWLLTFVLQSPKLYEEILSEVDALPERNLADVDFKGLAPHLNSAIQETLRYVSAVFAGQV